MDEIEKRRRFMALVRGGDKAALKIVVKAWKGKTVRAAAETLGVTSQTLHNWRYNLPELKEMLK